MKHKILFLIITVLVLLVQPLYAAELSDTELFLNGLTYFFNSNYQEAIDNFAKVQDNEQLKIESLYYSTLAYIKTNNVVEAKEGMTTLQELGYQFGRLNWEMGLIYLNKKGQFDSPFYNEARKLLEKANSLGIDSPEFHSDLAMAYQGLGNLEKAADEYQIALSQGGDVNDYINLAALYKETGHIEQAINTYLIALKQTESMSVYLNLGNLYLQKEEYVNAINALEKGLNINSSFAALRSRLALAYYQNGNIADAKTEYKKIIKQTSNNYEAYYYLGKISFKYDQDLQSAIYYFNEAIKYNPNYARAYIALGNIYLSQDNAYKAIAQYTSAIEKNTNYPDGHYYLALAYQKLNMKEAAIAELRKTLHLDSNFKDARQLLDNLLEE